MTYAGPLQPGYADDTVFAHALCWEARKPSDVEAVPPMVIRTIVLSLVSGCAVKGHRPEASQ
jgi:hypothetical protein